MGKMIKPYSLLLYLLSILVFFFAGLAYGGMSGAAEGQGLAGGAIIFFYGLAASVIGLIFSLFITNKLERRIIVRINQILSVFLLLAIIWFAYRFSQKQTEKNPLPESSKKVTKTVDGMIGSLNMREAKEISEGTDNKDIGLGFYIPNFIEHSVHYFYGPPDFGIAAKDPTPVDSIVFFKTKYGQYDISYAPPWLVPDHMKLDYDFFYLKTLTTGRRFAEVNVNSVLGKTVWVDLHRGGLQLWSQFFLGVHSVEFDPGGNGDVRLKPLLHSSKVNRDFDLMTPRLIKDKWMFVELIDTNYQKVGEGWIQWRDEDKLLVNYNLLS